MHLRHSLFLTARSRTFSFIQWQKEKAIDLDRRLLLGGGLRYQVVSLGSGGVDLGVGVMLVDGDAGVVKLSGTTYFQPILSDWSEHRVLLAMSAIIPLVKYLGLDLSGSWRREIPSPRHIDPNDASLRVGLRVALN